MKSKSVFNRVLVTIFVNFGSTIALQFRIKFDSKRAKIDKSIGCFALCSFSPIPVIVASIDFRDRPSVCAADSEINALCDPWSSNARNNMRAPFL